MLRAPEAALLTFLATTYEAAARLGSLDGARLETDLGRVGTPQRIAEEV